MAEKKEKKEKKISIEKDILEDIKFSDVVSKLPWNSSGSKWGKRRIDDINKIIIHQSLSDAKLENINAYSISKNNHIVLGKGCPHIPYHMAIDKDGKIFLCNSFEDYTWHTKGQNRVGLGVCILGNFIGTGWNKGHDPTEKQMKACEELIKAFIESKKIDIGKKDIYGHYHFGKPACPGKALSILVEKIRGNKTDNRLDTVKEIQQALIDLGFNLPKFGADGVMGTETKEAIVKFQTLYKIPVTGIAEERTRHELIKAISKKG